MWNLNFNRPPNSYYLFITKVFSFKLFTLWVTISVQFLGPTLTGESLVSTSVVWTSTILEWLKLQEYELWRRGRLQCLDLPTEFIGRTDTKREAKSNSCFSRLLLLHVWWALYLSNPQGLWESIFCAGFQPWWFQPPLTLAVVFSLFLPHFGTLLLGLAFAVLGTHWASTISCYII